MNWEELLQLIEQAAEDGREELDLSSKGLTTLPKEIGKLKNLKVLVLDDNQISKISDAISELKNLTELYLVGNQINKIPDAIAELKNLTELYLGSNQISKIPDAIAELKNLTILYLSGNQISVIPDAIAELKNLTGLFLHNNQISEIPDLIIELKNLKTLDLGNNLIREIPAEIIHLENLERDQDEMIEGINIEGNPIINPPYEIAAKGIYAIHSYFLRQQNQQLSRYKDNNTMINIASPTIMINIASTRDKIFVSYSHKDKKWLNEFQTHIKPFVRADGFEIWDDTKIESGSEWREEIEKALASAKVAVLLVTHHFIASDFIHNKELPPLFDAAEKEGLTIFWIPIRASNYTETKIEKYQSAHPPDKPLLSLNTSKRDEAWVNICKKIAHKMKQSD